MSDVLFNVVFNGVLNGTDPQQAQAQFAALFSLDADRTAKIFASGKATLKTNVTQAQADQYVARLAAIGVDASAIAQAASLALEPMAPEPEAETSAPEIATQVPLRQEFQAAPSREAVAPAQTTEQTMRFEFSGKGGEYFKIWIVNILLSILTLGIYSAWAKVRNHQYFYGNTRLNDATFEYTAKPVQILKGRLLAFAFLIIYSVVAGMSPALGLLMALVLLVLLPWILVLSLRFNARYTTYRNIAFRFNGSIGGAFKALIAWPLLGIVSLGILFPFVWKKQTEYIVGNHAYGATGFSFAASVKEYYKLLFMLLGGALVFGVLLALVGGSFAQMMVTGDLSMAVAIPMALAYLAFYLIITAFVVTTMANIQFNNTRLAQHGFAANWQTLSYAKLLGVNTVLILVTLGLFIPFAKIRTAAYKAEHTQFIARGDLTQFVAAEKEQVNALAEGVNDLFALDISI